MSNFVEVPRDAFIAKMAEAGFTLSVLSDNVYGEMVFVRRNHYNHDLVVKIYSSIPMNAAQARDCGEDAIRVVAVYDPPPGHGAKGRGLFKAKVLRVTSVEGVLERTLARAREAYVKTNQAARVIGPAISVVA